MSLNASAVFVALADPFADSEGEPLVAFYTALFAQKPAIYRPQAYAEFHLPGLRLGIFQPKPDQRQQFVGQAGSISLCIEVDSLESAIEHLKTVGHSPASTVMTTSHGQEVYLYDPAGNRLILHESA